MGIEELQASVMKAAEKVAKCTATIGKHEAAAAKKMAALAKWGINADNMEEKKWLGGKPGTGGSANYWDICEVEGKLRDAAGAKKKLKDAEAVLANWQAKIDVEIEKDRFLNDEAPAVIKEFLAQWKARSYDWHMKNYPRYIELKQTVKDLKEEAQESYRAKNPGAHTWGRDYEKYIATECPDLNGARAALAGYGGWISQMDTYPTEEARLAYLEKELENERRNKMLDLIYRVNAVVGTITDAKGLRIDVKGNLNGIIVGEKGKAKIETIAAGGYNIQCFHFRTLVHEIKEEVLTIRKGKPLTAALNELAREVEKELGSEVPVDGSKAQGAFVMEIQPTGRVHGKLGQQLYMDI